MPVVAEDLSQPWQAGAYGDPALWAALTGGVGGLISLAFAPLARPRRRSGQRTLAGAGDDIRLRFDNGACPTAAPAAPASPAAAKTSWIGRWLGRAGSSQPWRIRL